MGHGSEAERGGIGNAGLVGHIESLDVYLETDGEPLKDEP